MIAASSITWHLARGTEEACYACSQATNNRDDLPIGQGQVVRSRSGSDQIDRDVDVAAGGF